MTIRWQDLKPRDRAVLDFGGPLEVHEPLYMQSISSTPRGVWFRKPNVQPFMVPGSLAEHISFTLEARPLAVGDRVMGKITGRKGGVIAVHGDRAWIQLDELGDNGAHEVWALCDAERIP